MKFQKLIVAALGVVTLGVATLSLTLNSNAQGGGPGAAAGPRGVGQGGPPAAPQGPGFPGGAQAGGQFRGGAGGFGGGGGGGTAIDSDNMFLYVVQGNMLFKVGKSDLKIVGSTPLGQMPMRGAEFPPPGRSQGIPSGPPPPPPTESK